MMQPRCLPRRTYKAEERGAVFDAPEGDARARAFNDLALAATVKAANFDGEFTEWAGHHYYFDATPPAFDAFSGGIVGADWGTDLVTDSRRGGTHFRHRSQGDFLRLGASHTVLLSGLVFWPTVHKTTGTEITIDDRAYRCHLHDLQFHNVNRSISVAGGIFTRLERIHTQSFWAAEAYKITAAPSLANANEDTLFYDVHSISPLRVAIGPQPTAGVAGHVRDRTNGMTVIVGDFARWSGHYFQAEIAGVTGGSTPTIPTYVTSADRYSMKIADGGVTWAWYCRENAAGARVGSGGNYATFADCKFMQGVHGIESVNDISGGSFAKQLTIRDLVDDHPISDHVKIGGGRIIEIKSNKLESSALGCAVRLASGCDELNVHDNIWPDNALGGLINNAGYGYKKLFKNNIPDGNDQTIAATADGRVFANPAIGQIKYESFNGLNGWSIYQEPSGADLNKVKARNETTGNTAPLVVP